MSEYKEGTVSYDALKQYTVITPVMSSVPVADQQDVLELPDAVETDAFTVDFDGLRSINPDIAAWLFCENTAIDYPVVQGYDNSYYLSHLFDKTQNKAGCLFIDIDNAADFTDKHTIIYGHNMKDGSMFNTLVKYKEQSYYDAHPQMTLVTPEATYTLALFAGYIADVDSDAWKMEFKDDGDFKNWIESAKKKSSFQCDVGIAPGERVVTLSTCTYESDNVRYVVIGKLISLSQISH